jgi:hypothetical protein
VLLYLAHGVELLLLVPIQRVLWAASLLAEALVVGRLLREGLLRKYPFFAAFLTADVICSIVLIQMTFLSLRYAEAFRLCTWIMTVFRLGVAGELYERICEHFPGIGRFRIALAASVVLIAAVVTAFTFRPNLVDKWVLPQTVVEVIQRFQSEILAGALALTWIFLRFVLSIRHPFQPNVLNHWRIATIYFGVSGVAYLMILLSKGGRAVLPINCAMLALDIACFVTWFRLLRRSGEELPAFRRLTPEQVQAVEKYNSELLGTVRSLPGEISARQAESRDTPLYRGRLR